MPAPRRRFPYRAPYALVRKLAASFDIVGPLLGRFGRAEVPLRAAAYSGPAQTDMHEQAFVALGCDVHNAHGYLIAQSKAARARRDDQVSHAERPRDEERDVGGGFGGRNDDAETSRWSRRS